jgi:hypothetical protein
MGRRTDGILLMHERNSEKVDDIALRKHTNLSYKGDLSFY